MNTFVYVVVILNAISTCYFGFKMAQFWGRLEAMKEYVLKIKS